MIHRQEKTQAAHADQSHLLYLHVAADVSVHVSCTLNSWLDSAQALAVNLWQDISAS